jgi:2-methylcitrate dehydratase PrpD
VLSETQARPISAGAAAPILAAYASGLEFGAIPDAVLDRARACVADTVGASVYGHLSPAGQIVVATHAASGAGRCAVLGAPADTPLLGAEQAALVNGTLAHALELDSLRQPGAGVHPGAVLVPAALAIAQEEGLSGRALLTAVVAGCEVLFRIGRATKHSAEARGFHAPGLTGPFGAAVACGHLLGLSADAMTRAIGIAGSLGGGLLEFAASGEGGMVKRLHLGRAAAAGVLAARLAQRGFTAPSTVLEGEHGFLHAYCKETDLPSLVSGLGEEFETLSICFKAYACHITAHTPVHAARQLQAQHGFAPADVASVRVEGTPKMAALHGNRRPADTVAAQYSIAFCVAAALLRDPTDPAAFTQSLGDPALADLCERVEVAGAGGFASSWATRTTIRLHDGRAFTAELDTAPGFPAVPFTPDQLRRKFMALTTSLGDGAAPLFDRLQHLEDEPSLDWLLAPRNP